MNFKNRSFSIENIGLIVTMIAMTIIFTSINSNYLTSINLVNILVAASLVGLVAIGETYLIIGGAVDLSPGATAALASVLVSVFITNLGLNPLISIILVIAIGGLIGLMNAIAVNKLKIEPFIATLATMSIVRGFAYIACNGRTVYVMNEWFLSLNRIKILWLPLSVIILIIAFIIFGIVLKKTVFGRNIYVIGGNKTAARLAGISPQKVLTKLYIITGMLSATGGVLLASRMTSGQPSASVGLEFDAITAAVLGGTAFSGGIGSMFGTVLGVILLQGFNTGLIMVNVPTFWQNVARGALLLLALAFDFYRNNKRKKEELRKMIEEN